MRPLALLSCALLVGACRDQVAIENFESARLAEELTDRSAVGEELSERYRELVRYFAPAHVPLAPSETLSMHAGAYHDHIVELREGEVYSFLALADAISNDVDLLLSDPNGQPVAFDTSPDAFPLIVAYEAPMNGIYNLRIEARDAGRVEFGVWTIEDSSHAEAWRLAQALRLEHLPNLHFEHLQETAISELEPASIPFPLLPGRCYAWIAVGPSTMRDLDAWLRVSPEQELRTDLSTENSVVLDEFCPEVAITPRLELRTYTGGGLVHWAMLTREAP